MLLLHILAGMGLSVMARLRYGDGIMAATVLDSSSVVVDVDEEDASTGLAVMFPAESGSACRVLAVGVAE